MVNKLMDKGITPVIWWQYYHPHQWLPFPGSGTSLQEHCLKGRHDPLHQEVSKGPQGGLPGPRWNRRIIIRPFHEATGTWFPWGIGFPGQHAQGLQESTGAHLHKDSGAVVPRRRRASGFPVEQSSQPPRRAYPGDKYVVDLSFTVLNWGKRKGKWRPNVTPRFAKKRPQPGRQEYHQEADHHRRERLVP